MIRYTFFQYGFEPVLIPRILIDFKAIQKIKLPLLKIKIIDWALLVQNQPIKIK